MQWRANIFCSRYTNFTFNALSTVSVTGDSNLSVQAVSVTGDRRSKISTQFKNILKILIYSI